MKRLLLLFALTQLVSCVITNNTYLHPAKDLISSPPQVLPPSNEGVHLEGGLGLGLDSRKSITHQTLYGQATWRKGIVALGLGGSLARGHTRPEADSCYLIDEADSTCYTPKEWNQLSHGADFRLYTISPGLGLVFGDAENVLYGFSFSLVYSSESGDYSHYRNDLDSWPYVEKVGGDQNWYKRYAAFFSFPLREDWRLGIQMNNDVPITYSHQSDGWDLFGDWTLAAHMVLQNGPWQAIAGLEGQGYMLRLQYQSM